MSISIVIRTVAIFVYILAALYGLKAASDLATGSAAANGQSTSSAFILAVCIIAAASAWWVDRHYCRLSAQPQDKQEK